MSHILVIANIAAYFLVPPAYRPQLAFAPYRILEQPWSLVTYMFLHGGGMHLLFNMLGLYFFGPRLEALLGGRRFLSLYVVSGLVAAGLSAVFSTYTPIVGASGAIFGVMLGFAQNWPRERIFLWGIVPIQARWFVLIMTGLSLYMGFGAASDGVAHFAHVGGFLGAFIYLRLVDRKRSSRLRASGFVDTPSRAVSPDRSLARWSRIRRDAMHEVNRAEVDRLFAKIESNGVESLSAAERNFLDNFSAEA